MIKEIEMQKALELVEKAKKEAEEKALKEEAEKEKEMLDFFRKKQEEKCLRIQNKIAAFMLSLQKEENCELIIGYPNNVQPQILIKLL